MTNRRCLCGVGEDTRMCVDGNIYGSCAAPNCPGACEYEGACECRCHKPGDGGER